MNRKKSPPRIVSARVTKPHALALQWDTGEKATVDLAADIRRYKSLAPLRNEEEFRRAKVGEWGHGVEWPCGVDIGADSLWRDTLIALGHADAVALDGWRMKHGMTLDRTADALGLSRRMVAYYLSGEKPVPRTVLLACAGYDAGAKIAA